MNKWQKKTDAVLLEMLTENTGRHFLDSGGAHGRNYDRNAKRDFRKEPVATIGMEMDPGRHNSVSVELNLFHWLREKVAYAPDLQRAFNGFCRRKDYLDDPDLVLMENFAGAHLQEEGHSPEEFYTENSYNRDNVLDQTIQYTAWPVDNPEYTLLQIHGGCDVRGGYTRPRAFSLPEGDLRVCNATISCANCGKYWPTDDSVHWLEMGFCGGEWSAKALELKRLILPVVPEDDDHWHANYVAEMSPLERAAWEILVALHSKNGDVKKMAERYPSLNWERIAAHGEKLLHEELGKIREKLPGVILEIGKGRYTCPACPTGVLGAWA